MVLLSDQLTSPKDDHPALLYSPIPSIHITYTRHIATCRKRMVAPKTANFESWNPYPYPYLEGFIYIPVNLVGSARPALLIVVIFRREKLDDNSIVEILYDEDVGILAIQRDLAISYKIRRNGILDTQYCIRKVNREIRLQAFQPNKL
jgi:hypothetical protein